jgi:hypothetical protein
LHEGKPPDIKMSKQITEGRRKGARLVKRLEKLTNNKSERMSKKLKQVKGNLKKDLGKARKKF